MRIGILYNLSDHAKTGQSVEKTADSDTPLTVRAIKAIFEKRHTVIPIKFTPDIYSYLVEGNVDILFNMCEGFRDDNLGEAYAGTLLEQARVPFTGSNFFTLALCMDKARTKEILRYHNLPTPDFAVLRSPEKLKEITLPFPIIAKPLYEDASIGIYQDSVIRDRETLYQKGAQLLEKYNQPILFEEYIDGRELNVSIVGNNSNLQVFPVSEILFNLPESYNRIVCFDAKWVKESIPYSNTPSVCPAQLSKQLEEEVTEIAKKAFTVAGCSDYARIDLRVRAVEGREEATIIEINPNPGKYLDSGFVRSAVASGLSYEQLCYTLLETAMKRYNMDVARLEGDEGNQGKDAGIEIPDDGRVAETDRLFALRIKEKHLPVLLSWFNDKEIARYMDEPDYIYTEQELYEMFLISEVHDMDCIFFDKESQLPVGYGSVYDVDYKNKTGEISYLIGNNGFRSKGYGTEMGKAMISVCFNIFNLNSIYASSVVENKASIQSVLRNGFKQIGIRRQSHFVEGVFYDEVLFDLTRKEYQSN